MNPQVPVLLFLDISGGELLVIMLVVFLVFGPEKMPEIARKAGQVMTKLKQASSDFTREIKKETSALHREMDSAGNGIVSEVNDIKKEYQHVRSQVINDNFVVNSNDAPAEENPKSHEQSTKPPDIEETTSTNSSPKG